MSAIHGCTLVMRSAVTSRVCAKNRQCTIARKAIYEIGGKLIKAGERVAMWYLSGNRDPEAIDNPEAFVIDRAQPRRHLSFGFGAHHCVGYRVAELQLKIVWEEIMQRFRRIEVSGEPQRVCSNIIHGFTSLPVTLQR